MRKKILLVLPYSNGDCLFGTAVARQIKKDYPGCLLTWAVAPFCRNILLHNPWIDEIIETPEIVRNDPDSFVAFKKKVLQQKEAGLYDEVFFLVVLDTNQAYYDGTSRSSIFRGYPNKVKDIQPVLVVSPEEEDRVKAWMASWEHSTHRHVILFEFAPQSGQVDITPADAERIAERLTDLPGVAVVMSSAHRINSPKKGVIDGSALSIRETIFFSNYCTLLLGCSSGISWGTTSSAGKLLPMVQMVYPEMRWINPISRDFERQGIPLDGLIELMTFDTDKITACVSAVIREGFAPARERYNEPLPLHFKTTRRIVYNLLCYLHFSAIITHVRVNTAVYGLKPAFWGELFIGIAGSPFRLVGNVIRKRFFKQGTITG